MVLPQGVSAKELFKEFDEDDVITSEEMEIVKSKVVGDIYYAWKIPLETIDAQQSNRKKCIPLCLIPPCCLCLPGWIVCAIDRREYMEAVIFAVGENGVTIINRGPGGCICCCNAAGYGQNNTKLYSWDNILDTQMQDNKQVYCRLESPSHVLLTLKTTHRVGSGDSATSENDTVVLWHKQPERLAHVLQSLDRMNGDPRGQKVYLEEKVVIEQPPPSYDAAKVRLFVAPSSDPTKFEIITVPDGKEETFEKLLREKFSLGEKVSIMIQMAEVGAECKFDDLQNNDKVVIMV